MRAFMCFWRLRARALVSVRASGRVTNVYLCVCPWDWQLKQNKVAEFVMETASDGEGWYTGDVRFARASRQITQRGDAGPWQHQRGK